MSLVSDRRTKNGKKYGRSLYPWHFDKIDLMTNTPSRDDGITYEEELRYRQKACLFLYEMVIKLTQRGEHLATGVAAIFLNRFFKFHSFKKLDYRDVAAACLFLSGKNEDSPRKLKYIVNLWWTMKYPHQKTFHSEEHFFSACDFIVAMENLLLKTLAFDMNVDLPHQYVLKLMQEIEKGRNTYKEMVKTAYYLSTDILLITDWSIRYSCSFIATACVQIACHFHDLDMTEIAPSEVASRWFQLGDRNLTLDILKEMEDEFLNIFSKRPELHIGSLRKIDPKGKVKINRQPSPSVSSSILPPPPTAPVLTPKKIDMSAYKERQKVSLTETKSRDSPRQSFLPDVQNPVEVKKELEKSFKSTNPLSTNEKSRKHHSSHHHHHHHHHHHQKSLSSSIAHREKSSSSSNNGRHQNNSHKHYSESSSHRSSEERRSKRDYPEHKSELQPNEKRSKVDDKYGKSTYQLEVEAAAAAAAVSVRVNGSGDSSKSAYQKMCMDIKHKNEPRKQMDPSPPTVSPPAPPPPTLVYSTDIEDGELR